MWIENLHSKTLVVALLMLTLSSMGYAQDDTGSEPKADQEAVVQNDDDSASKSESKPKADESSTQELDDEAFIPSEEISEDLSVAFPVDI